MQRAILTLLAIFGLVVSNTAYSHDISTVVPKVLHSIAYVEVEKFDINSLIDNGISDIDFQKVRSSPIIGTGFVTEGNFVITNFHVVEYAIRNNTKIRVSFYDTNEEPLYATIVGYDKTVDVAVLKLPKTRPSVSICPSGEVYPGQDVFSISHFYGIEFSVTKGIISSVDRTDPRYPYVHQLQLQLLEGSGSSGGPVFNEDGMVVSMNQSILAMIPSALSDGPVKMLSNVAFSIRGDSLSNSIERIKKEKIVRRADLGVAVGKFSPGSPLFREIEPANKKLRGVMVVYLDNDVKNHVLRPGDIITKIGTQTITDPEQFFLYLDSRYKIGDFVKLQVYRRGSTINISVPVFEAGER
jgi:S1-C subfamily serine protease